MGDKFSKFTLNDVEKAINKKEMYLGVKKYIFIMDMFREINVYNNKAFKYVFIDFYKLDMGVDERFLDKYFYFLEINKNNYELTYIETLRYLYKYSNKVHVSYASKILATINNKLPIIDKFVKRNLEIEEIYGVLNINKIIEQYYELIDIYNDFLNTDKSKLWIEKFDEKFPNNNIESIKKIDFILWQMR